MTNNIVTANKLSISFNNQPILQHLSFNLPQGSMTSLLGMNGVGKTTLVRILTKQLRPDSGTVQYTPNKIRIGYVPQFRNFDNDYPLSIRNFISLNLYHNWRPWLIRSEKAQLEQVLAATKLTHLQNNRLSEASGGEKQRAYLAQALVNHPQLLILDEATASLDIHAKIQLMELVKQINERNNLTVLFITHDINLACQYTQRYLMLHPNGNYELKPITQLPRNLQLN